MKQGELLLLLLLLLLRRWHQVRCWQLPRRRRRHQRRWRCRRHSGGSGTERLGQLVLLLGVLLQSEQLLFPLLLLHRLRVQNLLCLPFAVLQDVLQVHLKQSLVLLLRLKHHLPLRLKHHLRLQQLALC